jgi:hypothetical protein
MFSGAKRAMKNHCASLSIFRLALAAQPPIYLGVLIVGRFFSGVPHAHLLGVRNRDVLFSSSADPRRWGGVASRANFSAALRVSLLGFPVEFLGNDVGHTGWAYRKQTGMLEIVKPDKPPGRPEQTRVVRLPTRLRLLVWSGCIHVWCSPSLVTTPASSTIHTIWQVKQNFIRMVSILASNGTSRSGEHSSSPIPILEKSRFCIVAKCEMPPRNRQCAGAGLPETGWNARAPPLNRM